MSTYSATYRSSSECLQIIASEYYHSADVTPPIYVIELCPSCNTTHPFVFQRAHLASTPKTKMNFEAYLASHNIPQLSLFS